MKLRRRPVRTVHLASWAQAELPLAADLIAGNTDVRSDGDGAGIARCFLRPWPWSGRVVADVAGEAEPMTGYPVRVDGQGMVIGGASALAPLWAGLIAIANAASGRRAGCIHDVLYGRALAGGVPRHGGGGEAMPPVHAGTPAPAWAAPGDKVIAAP